MVIDFGENIMNVLLLVGVIMSVILVIAIQEFGELWRKFK